MDGRENPGHQIDHVGRLKAGQEVIESGGYKAKKGDKIGAHRV
jgi:hypothetical protein